MLSNHFHFLVANSRRCVLTSGSRITRWSQQQARCFSLRPALGCSTPPPSNQERHKRDSHHWPLPSVSIESTLSQRWMSATTAPPSDSKLSAAASKDKTFREPPTAVAAEEAAALGEDKGYRDRFRDGKNNMRTHYKDFREHPGQRARQGAKSAGEMLRLYGPVFAGTYLTIYAATLGTLYSGIQSGVLDPVALFGWLGQDTGESKNTVDIVVEFMQHYSFTKPYAVQVEAHPYLANLAVAWIAVKFTEPIRLAVAIPITPRVARYCGYGPKIPDDESMDEAQSDADSAQAPPK